MPHVIEFLQKPRRIEIGSTAQSGEPLQIEAEKQVA